MYENMQNQIHMLQQEMMEKEKKHVEEISKLHEKMTKMERDRAASFQRN